MAFEFTDSNFEETALEGVVLIDFWATWSGPSRAMAPTIEELAADYKGRALVGKLDVDNNPEVAVKYHIVGLPTILFLRNGEVVRQILGLSTKQVLAITLDAALATM